MSEPVEVWLRQKNMAVTCTVVREDESTYPVDVESLSMRGAQREITSRLVDEGYAPVGRWNNDLTAVAVRVTSRRFRCPT